MAISLSQSLFLSKCWRTSSGWPSLNSSLLLLLGWNSIPAKIPFLLKYRAATKIDKNTTIIKTLITKAQIINEHGPTVSPIVLPTDSGINIPPVLDVTRKRDAVLPDTVTKFSAQLMPAGKTEDVEMPKITVPTHNFVESAALQSPSLICEISTADPNRQPTKSKHSILDGGRYFEMGTAASRANAKLPQKPEFKSAAPSLLIFKLLVLPNAKIYPP